ncbi:MAG: glycoside hydrolase family 88 protein [Dysgonamonadaceae bacterium]|jgi:rhamnogalacturonyl hydrolase YesR/polygalacturonase|nr:glycoside hydrolase family 88 protein [Dysgonamonadaceae bacterium]
MNKFLKKISLLLFCLTLLPVCVKGKEPYKYEYLYKNLPFDMPRVKAPVFPNNQVSITDFGGVGDGVTLNTEAFAKAMDALSKKGGGTLNVPFGVWFTGPIVFKSNINLHLAEDALILFTPDFDAYPLVNIVFEGLDTRRCQSPISGRNLQNIAITGKGAINGSGQAWRPVKKGKVTASQWKEITSTGGIIKSKDTWFPSQKSLRGNELSDMNVPRNLTSEAQWDSIKDFLRPVMISFVECKNVLLQGVLFENSPAWNIHPLMCENVIIDGIFARNPAYAQNGDGLDLESCKNSIIVNSIFDVGDDGICIKSGKDADGRKRGRPTENVIVDNCKVFQGHGGFVVGSEMSGGVKNISVSRCQFLGTDVGLRFKSTRGRGGVVENIYITNISMFDIVTDSFLFDLYYGGKSASESLADGDKTPVEKIIPAVTEETPVFRNIYVKNLVSRNARRAMFFNGLPEMNITNINVENATISARYGAEIAESAGVNFKNVRIIPAEGPALILRNVKDFKSDIEYKENAKYYVRMADSEMKRNPESWMLDFSAQPKWNYCQGLVLQSILQVWKKTGDKKYFAYAQSYADTMILNNGKAIRTYKVQDYNLDHINPGKILFPLYKQTKDEKYKNAILLLRDQIKSQPRTSEGGFWHKNIYPHQMWLDGIYMASPFLAEYAATFNEPALFDDIALQIITVASKTHDPKTGLYYHGWDESKQERWANPETGQSPNFWSRSMGWYAMAMVDVLDFLPENHPKRQDIIHIFQQLILSLEKVQDPETGLWYQVTDKIGEKGNYLESTGSIMFIYSMIKGAQKGYLPKDYEKKAGELYKSFIRNFVKEEPDGTLSITNCCSVAGLGGKNYRDGSYQYYISEPVRDNDPKATGPFIMTSLLLNK